MSLDISQVLIQIIGFLIMLWVLKKFGWKPILNMLDERKQQIRSEFDSIDSQKAEIRQLAEEYQEKLRGIEAEARHKIQEAISHGRQIAMEIQAEAKENAKELLLKAKSEVDKEVVKARNQLKNEIANISLALAEKILQEKLDESKHQELIIDFVERSELK